MTSGAAQRIAFRLAGVALAALLQTAPAEAAGRDCAKPKGPYETAICDDPDLLGLDQDLATAYDRLAAMATPAGGNLVRRDEKGRRAYIEELCHATDDACLATAYRQGLSSIAKFSTQPDGATFLPVERYRLYLPKVSVLTAFPRLDRPAEPWADGFEKAARARVDSLLPDDPHTDTTIDYRPTYLAPDLAAVVFLVRIYPHALTRRVAFNYLPALRQELRAVDLFQSGTTWSFFLAGSALAGLRAQAETGRWALTVPGPGNLEKAIADPANWMIRPAGLGLYFAPGSVADDATGEHEVLIPWTDLKDYLLPTPAFQIPTN